MEFVRLDKFDPTILISPRYYSGENFIGKQVDGYKNPFIILTVQAVQALKKVQDDVKKDG